MGSMFSRSADCLLVEFFATVLSWSSAAISLRRLRVGKLLFSFGYRLAATMHAPILSKAIQ